MKVKNTEIHFVGCHRKPERSLFWRGKQLPVCARCTGFHIGYLAFPVFLFSWWTLDIWWTLALIIPTYADGTIQGFTKWESKNWLRLSTGIMAGVGLMSLISIIGKSIGDFIIFMLK